MENCCKPVKETDDKNNNNNMVYSLAVQRGAYIDIQEFLQSGMSAPDSVGLWEVQCNSDVHARLLLYGQPYDANTLEVAAPDTLQGKKEFVICLNCIKWVQLYNKLVHQKYIMYIECSKRVTERRSHDRTKETTEILNELLADEPWLNKLFMQVRLTWADVEKAEREKKRKLGIPVTLPTEKEPSATEPEGNITVDAKEDVNIGVEQEVLKNVQNSDNCSSPNITNQGKEISVEVELDGSKHILNNVSNNLEEDLSEEGLENEIGVGHSASLKDNEDVSTVLTEELFNEGTNNAVENAENMRTGKSEDMKGDEPVRPIRTEAINEEDNGILGDTNHERKECSSNDYHLPSEELNANFELNANKNTASPLERFGNEKGTV